MALSFMGQGAFNPLRDALASADPALRREAIRSIGKLAARAPIDTREVTPLLITDPEGEQFWPGQSQQLFDALSGAKRLISFTAAEGADRHCEPMARTLVEQRIFDWLDETLRTDRLERSAA